jgi:predicted transposase YdaD
MSITEVIERTLKETELKGKLEGIEEGIEKGEARVLEIFEKGYSLEEIKAKLAIKN